MGKQSVRFRVYRDLSKLADMADKGLVPIKIKTDRILYPEQKQTEKKKKTSKT